MPVIEAAEVGGEKHRQRARFLNGSKSHVWLLGEQDVADDLFARNIVALGAAIRRPIPLVDPVISDTRPSGGRAAFNLLCVRGLFIFPSPLAAVSFEFLDSVCAVARDIVNAVCLASS